MRRSINLQGVQKTIRWIIRSMNLYLCFFMSEQQKEAVPSFFFKQMKTNKEEVGSQRSDFLNVAKDKLFFSAEGSFFPIPPSKCFCSTFLYPSVHQSVLKKVFINLTERVRVLIDKLVETTIDRGCLVKKLINCRLIKSTWKIVPVSIYKTYTNLSNLTNAFDQSALGSDCSTDWGVLVVWTGKKLCTLGHWYL